MKERPKYFLADDKIDHEGEVFSYIQELHEYLWRFVRVHVPGAGGSIRVYLDQAVELAEGRPGMLPTKKDDDLLDK